MHTSDGSDHMRWFHEARLGMFIHWGAYSLLGRGTWVMHNDNLSVETMRSVADEFDPQRFDADGWATLAKEAGMRYAVLTTRHHDGFCLFDSSVSDFTTVNGSAGRDFVAEYVSAFRDAGLRVGLYYSLLDWRFPGYFEPERYPESYEAMVTQLHAQVRELLTNYGKIDLLWFDGHWLADVRASLDGPAEVLRDFWRSDELMGMIRELQPDIVVNDRAALPADYDTPEQTVRLSPPGRAWEVCETIGDWDQAWAHQRFNPQPIRKSPGQVILELTTVARNEGNLLLNVGPDADGEIPAAEVECLEQLGEWMSVHGEAIYGSERSPLRGNAVGNWIFKDRVGYLFMACWPGNEVIVCDIDGQIESVELMGSDTPVTFDHDRATGRLTIRGLPDSPPHPDVSAVRVTFEGHPTRMEHPDRSWWLAQ